MSFKEQIDLSRLPSHIAVIMDGNGRWAKQQGKNRVFGHQEGVKAVRRATESCAKLGVQYLTLYTFSTENWSRPSFEVTALMELLVTVLRREVNDLNRQNIRVNAIGDLSLLPKRCQEELQNAMSFTQNNTRMTLTLALNYGSRQEIVQAVRQIAADTAGGKLLASDINEGLFASYLSTHQMPDPELLIRTSGEQRISNYLLWQIAYTELYFTDRFWPDFDEEELCRAIVNYQQRDRRFGKIESNS